MLPSRAYAQPLAPFSAGRPTYPAAEEERQAFVVAVAAADVDQFPNTPLTRLAARNTTEAIRFIERRRPRVVAIDWDLPEFDGPAITAAARQHASTAILVTLREPERAPGALKAGCHGLLLKPFAPNLIAARVGRLCREVQAMPAAARAAAALPQHGTKRTWDDLECPTCKKAGAVGFEFASHRRSWYACLGCDAVWLGTRRE